MKPSDIHAEANIAHIPNPTITLIIIPSIGGHNSIRPLLPPTRVPPLNVQRSIPHYRLPFRTKRMFRNNNPGSSRQALSRGDFLSLGLGLSLRLGLGLGLGLELGFV